MTTATAIASPAFAWEYCLDGNKTLYRAISAVSQQMAGPHGSPRPHGWKKFLVDTAADAFVTELAKSNFFVVKCPTDIERLVQGINDQQEAAPPSKDWATRDLVGGPRR
jgi:hypothetical protein